MKRNFLLLAIALFIVNCSAFANAVSEQNAQTVALNFFKSKANVGSTTVTATLNYTRTESSGAVDFYVFNMSPVKGFVMVSGNDNVEPIIAYSTESNFKNDVSSSVGVSDWMDQISARINTIVRMGLQADDNINGLWTAYNAGTAIGSDRATTVGPLLSTTWDQENDISTPPPYIYNLYCPYNSSEGERCVTGCVATAMAQIMKYWNWPATGTGSYSYDDSYNGGYGTLSFNFGATSFYWANMPTVLTDATTTAQNASVDTLMYACGVSVAMEYGTDDQGGSGAYVFESGNTPCAQLSYINYFGYASTMSGVQKSSYSATSWATLLTNELNAGRVIEYVGEDPGVGGHTWVCDGYESSTMFHMNWGWGGADNGYFSLSDLNPSPYTFNSDDGALIGIQPNSTTSCGVPSGLTTSGITTTGASLSWSAVSGASSYNVEYALQGSTTWTTVNTATASATLSILSSGTGYQWAVQTVCSSGSSAYSSPVDFTTSATATCGTIPSGLSAGTPGSSSATLTWGAVSGAVSYDLQWKESSASTWTAVTGITSATYPLSSLSSCTSYEFEVAAVCSAGSSSYSAAATFSTTGCTISYCASTSESEEYEYIKEVSLGTISSTTTGTDGGYDNLTSLSTNLTAGSTYTITLTPGFKDGSYNEYFTVYIDYNDNGLFTDAGETVLKVHGTKAVSGSFTVPTTATSGATRMRVQMQYGAYETNPCATYEYGDVQDFTVNIGSAASKLESPEELAKAVNLSDMNLYPNPAQENVTVQFTTNNSNQAVMNVYNLLGQRLMNSETQVVEGVNSFNINTSYLAAGVYIFEVENNGDVQRTKFVISR